MIAFLKRFVKNRYKFIGLTLAAIVAYYSGHTDMGMTLAIVALVMD